MVRSIIVFVPYGCIELSRACPLIYKAARILQGDLMDQRTWIAAIFSFALATVAARADDGCSKDTDCKGERICIARTCVNPNASVAPGNAVPASFDPATSAAQKPPAPITDTARPVAPVFSSTANRHLGGFVRPDLGLGYFSESASQNGVDASITGA